MCVWKRIRINGENVNWLLYYSLHEENDLEKYFFSMDLLHLHYTEQLAPSFIYWNFYTGTLHLL